MRYYRIEITDSKGRPVLDLARHPIGPYDSSTNPSGALDVTIDAPVYSQDLNAAGAMIIIPGLPLAALSQRVNLWLANIKVFAGFGKGLPLANPAQAGLIIQGQIYNPFGNWEGTQQSLNLVVNPSASVDSTGKPISITMNGKRGQKLSDVLREALTTAYPSTPINININNNLILVEDFKEIYFKIGTLASRIKGVTPGMLNIAGYDGVQIVTQKGSINVFDSSFKKNAIEIKVQDLIGQPTWVGFNSISLKTPMRSDLQIGDRISLPANVVNGSSSILAVNSQQSFQQREIRMNFSGSFIITSMRHVGQYRNPSGDAWVTTFEAAGIGN